VLESFKHLQIVEVAEGVAGPVCGLMFADLGACVRKIEPPEGDRSREWGPLVGDHSSAIFEQLNRGKQSVRCDLASDAGRQRFALEVVQADVVVVQMDPADRAACGIDWRALAEQHPGLIVCEIDDFGDRGPLANLPGSELTVQAMSGFSRYLGEVNGVPCRVGFEIGWMAGAAHVFHAACAALFSRTRSGQGQYVHVSSLGALLSMKSILFAANNKPDAWNGFHLLGPRWPADTGWDTKDGQITFDFRHQQRDEWVAFCNEVGLGHLPDHPDYKDWRSTIYIGDRRHKYGQPYREVFSRMTCEEASALINSHGGISVKFHTYTEVLAHAQTRVLDPLVHVAAAPEGARTQIGLPFRYSDIEQPRAKERAPRLGEHDAAAVPLHRTGSRKTAAESRATAGGPLQGVRVLDASMGAVGPWAGALLGQLGADVVKLESPQGDFIRNVMPTQRGLGTTYISMNFNKRGVVLDLKKPEDRAHVHALAQQADVFIENFRPGVADRIGVGYAELSALNPKLIYASASGFGPTGPMVEIGATDPHIQPFTGTCSVNGLPGGKHQRWRWYGHFDCTTATVIVQGVLAALMERETTGKGKLLQVTMLEAALALQRVRLAEHLAGCEPTRLGSGTTYLVPDQAFQTQDRWVAVSVTSRAQWNSFCAAIDCPEIANDEKFATNPQRICNRAELVPMMERIFAEKPAAYWLLALRQAGVPCALFTSIDDFRYHTHYLQNGMVESFDTPHWGPLLMGGIPWRFERTPAQLWPGTPPGACTEEIVRDHWPPLGEKG
jgi:crotonobetainyl-CoA:carnitine CoA-transferase CaiB-like acyl-CoA transferase